MSEEDAYLLRERNRKEMIAFLGGGKLAIRATNALGQYARIYTPKQLADTPLDDIRDTQNLGLKTFELICSKIIRPVRATPDSVAVDHGKIADFLTTQSERVASNDAARLLTEDEKAHVAKELASLADWYRSTA